MFQFLLGLVNPIGIITKKIADAYTARQNALTDQDRIKADVEIKTLETRRDVFMAEARTPGNVIMRAALASPVAFILWKVMVWDQTIGGTTFIGANTWKIIWIVLGFYFLDTFGHKLMNKYKY